MAEDAMELRKEVYDYIDPLEYLAEQLAKQFSISVPSIIVGTINDSTRAYYTVLDETITINSKGFCIATVLHEFAHHLQTKLDGSCCDHSFRFQRVYEMVLEIWATGVVTTKEKLAAIDVVTHCWETNEELYNKHWTESIDAEMLAMEIRRDS